MQDSQQIAMVIFPLLLDMLSGKTLKILWFKQIMSQSEFRKEQLVLEDPVVLRFPLPNHKPKDNQNQALSGLRSAWQQTKLSVAFRLAPPKMLSDQLAVLNEQYIITHLKATWLWLILVGPGPLDLMWRMGKGRRAKSSLAIGMLVGNQVPLQNNQQANGSAK